jgi:hypothetical protein
VDSDANALFKPKLPCRLFIPALFLKNYHLILLVRNLSQRAAFDDSSSGLRVPEGSPSGASTCPDRIVNGFPTGVKVTHAMIHGGPYPATSDGRSTSVGSQAIFRFARPVCYQDFPDSDLPQELRDGNPLGIWRMIDGEFMRGAVGAR